MTDGQFRMLLAELKRIRDAVEILAKAQNPNFRPVSARERPRLEKPEESDKD